MHPEETITRKRPTQYWSANFFDDPEIHVEDKVFWANNREGFNHDPGPRSDLTRSVPLQNQRTAEPQVTTRGRIEGSRKQNDAVETYDATEVEARREEEPANLSSEGRPPSEPVVNEPVMESETTDIGNQFV